ncbi:MULTISPECIES: sigma 54-interacting transcriptional regulator [unclassified Acidovorax]|uniref:sigma 54-interacting transcriptional regulator n=1 Tax=unclassified Acidovorax TaxID=2684926 RepID=UPI0028833E46|nr:MULTISPECIES: sigma 54-interacting transcriptional regulator [unclassified Acidovorax]
MAQVPLSVQPGASNRDEPTWREQEQLLLGEVMRLVGKSLAPHVVLREMLHLMSELLGLNRGRIVLSNALDDGMERPVDAGEGASIRYAYGLTQAEMARGTYAAGEGITGAVLATGQPSIVQDIDADTRFLVRSVERAQLPQETVAFIAVPIDLGRKTVGVLAAHRIRRRNRAISEDVAVMKLLATLAGQILQLRQLVAAQTQALESQNEMLSRALESATARYGIIGRSPVLLRALQELERVSRATASVLLLGESGTGKELFARALHLASDRHDGPFIKVNCAAIPETLFESELFGYEKGAFSGASSSRAGWFEQAHQGTIFLDEIGEMPLAMQVKLLRTLQEGTIIRLGGQREIFINVRVVAATNRDLATEVEKKNFRQDLFYRLNVIPIRLPSLSERREDIRPLAMHFLNKTNQQNQRNVHFTAQALEALEQQAWPGNIRELANVIERTVLLTDQTTVSRKELENWLPDAKKVMPDAVEKSVPAQAPRMHGMPLVREYLSRSSHDESELRQAMHLHGGNQTRAALSLGLTPRQFAYRWKRLADR